MKTTWNRLASFTIAVFTAFALHADTYFVQSLGGTSGPPYPFDPSFGALPLTQIGTDAYIVQDGDSGSFQSGGMMAMSSIDPGDTNNVGTNGNWSLPLLRNYVKYSQQIFSLLDTNSVLNDFTDTNLYNACAAISGATNGLPWLTIVPYGPNAVIIRADNFDYSQTNVDLALLVCDKVETPTWKAVDFNHASDAQDGWLVQGTVQAPHVTSTMFFQVTNLNMTYPAFFKVIPYDGPQVVLTGTNQPFDVVSNVISLTAQIYDLSGTTNEGFMVDVNGDNISTRSSLSNNTIILDTKYNPNGQDYGIDNVSLTVQGFASVYSSADMSVITNAPADMQTEFNSAASIPLDFENVNYLLFQSSVCSRSIGTNVIEFVCNKAEDLTCTITDPSNSNVVFYGELSIDGPTTVEIPWNMTEADGVTPYSNTVYNVNFTASDPDNFDMQNQIDDGGVRRATGCFITYQTENPLTGMGQLLNNDSEGYLGEELQSLYEFIYDNHGLTQYTPGDSIQSDIGPDRNYSVCQPLDLSHRFWQDIMEPALTNTFMDGNNQPTPKYSDLTIGGAHGNGREIGGAPGHIFGYLMDTFTPDELQHWLQEIGPRWRLRKVALWSCCSGRAYLDGTMDWMTACGIRSTLIQTRNYVDKNGAFVVNQLLPQLMESSDGGGTDTMPHVANECDFLWVTGPNEFPGACDPTYATFWVYTQLVGLYPDLADLKNTDFDARGYPYLPYTAIYDQKIKMLDHSNIKHPGVP